MVAAASTAIAEAERIAERMASAHRALAHLRALEGMPVVDRDAIDGAIGDVARALAEARQSLRTLGAELSVLESDGGALVGRVFARGVRRRGTMPANRGGKVG